MCWQRFIAAGPWPLMPYGAPAAGIAPTVRHANDAGFSCVIVRAAELACVSSL
jgi:hypothetical protein